MNKAATRSTKTEALLKSTFCLLTFLLGRERNLDELFGVFVLNYNRINGINALNLLHYDSW